MEKKIVESTELIAVRVPPGDKWQLVISIDSQRIVHASLTDVLEAYFNATKFKGEYRLSPLDSKLFVIKQTVEEIKPEPVKTLNIYGDPI
jgi:hypothetical protein